MSLGWRKSRNYYIEQSSRQAAEAKNERATRSAQIQAIRLANAQQVNQDTKEPVAQTKSKHAAAKQYVVTAAYYYGKDGGLRHIAGVPEAHQKQGYFGSYKGRYPHEAGQRAYGNLIKHMKKFHADRPWFPSYTPDYNPDILFRLQEEETGRTYDYRGYRERAPQSIAGPRVVINEDNQRKRIYNWVNKVQPEPLPEFED